MKKNKKKKFAKDTSPAKRLDILRTFLALVGIGQEKLADILNITRMTVCNWLLNDDLKISYLHAIFNKFGYALFVRLTRNPNQNDPVVPYDGRLAKYRDKGRLPYLCNLMDREGITIKDLANELNLDKSVVRRMFIKNDISLSRLISIAEAYGSKVVFDVIPFKELYRKDAFIAFSIKNLNAHNYFTEKAFRHVHTGPQLSFLRDLMTICGWNADDMATMFGISKNTVFKWFSKDDIYLRHIFHACTAAGYKCSLSLSNLDCDQEIITGNQIDTKSLFRELGVSVADAAKIIKISEATVSRTIRNNRVKLSHIVQIAAHYGLKLHIRVTANGDDHSIYGPTDSAFVWRIMPKTKFYLLS